MTINYVLVRMPTRDALRNAVNKAGSRRALGQYFGVTHQSIKNWMVQGVPMHHWGALLKYLNQEDGGALIDSHNQRFRRK